MAALLIAAVPLGSLAQATTAASAPPRSAPPATGPSRPVTPAVAPGTVEPERRATPQLNIPLYKSANAPPHVGAKRAAPSATSGRTDDAVARCKAQASNAERGQCP